MSPLTPLASQCPRSRRLWWQATSCIPSISHGLGALLWDIVLGCGRGVLKMGGSRLDSLNASPESERAAAVAVAEKAPRPLALVHCAYCGSRLPREARLCSVCGCEVEQALPSLTEMGEDTGTAGARVAEGATLVAAGASVATPVNGAVGVYAPAPDLAVPVTGAGAPSLNVAAPLASVAGATVPGASVAAPVVGASAPTPSVAEDTGRVASPASLGPSKVGIPSGSELPNESEFVGGGVPSLPVDQPTRRRLQTGPARGLPAYAVLPRGGLHSLLRPRVGADTSGSAAPSNQPATPTPALGDATVLGATASSGAGPAVPGGASAVGAGTAVPGGPSTLGSATVPEGSAAPGVGPTAASGASAGDAETATKLPSSADEHRRRLVHTALPSQVPGVAAPLNLGLRGVLHAQRVPVVKRPPETPDEIMAHGASLYEQGAFEEALPWLREAGIHGFAKAQFYVGYMHDRGVGMARDYVKALVWYLRAAQQGYAPAQFRVAVLYDKGHGTVCDKDRAFYWYLHAAQQGLAPAQKAVANCYNYGIGIGQNTTEAERWYLLSEGRAAVPPVQK